MVGHCWVTINKHINLFYQSKRTQTFQGRCACVYFGIVMEFDGGPDLENFITVEENRIFTRRDDLPVDSCLYSRIRGNKYYLALTHGEFIYQTLVCLFCLLAWGSLLVGVVSVMAHHDGGDFPMEANGDSDDDYSASILLLADRMTDRKNLIDVPQMVCVRGCEETDGSMRGFKWAKCLAVIPEDYDGQYTVPRSWKCQFPMYSAPGFCVDHYTVECEHLPYYGQWSVWEVMRDLELLCAVRYSVVRSDYCVNT